MKKIKKSFAHFMEIVASKKGAIYFIGLGLAPLLALIRFLFKQNDFLFYGLSLLFTFIPYYLLFFKKDFDKKLIALFVQAVNQRFTQNLLFIFLLYEQFIFTNFLTGFLFFTSFLIFCFHILSQGYFFAHCFVFFLYQLTLLYIKLRQNLLNVEAFAKSGMEMSESHTTWNWNRIMQGFHFAIQDKLQPGNNFNKPPVVGPVQNASLQAPIQVIMKTPATVVFPFFPIKNRRHMSTREAFRRAYTLIAESAQENFLPTVCAAGAGLSVVVAGGYTVFENQQKAAREDRRIDTEQEKLQLLRDQFQSDEKQKQELLKLESRKWDLVEQGKLPPSVLQTQPYVQLKPDGTLTSNLPGFPEKAGATDAPVGPNPSVGPNCFLEQSQINAFFVKFCETLQRIWDFFL
jgi:hypothetical protein